MRLLNCDTLKLESFGRTLPEYAILSHRWLDAADEVSFEDITKGVAYKGKPGFQKIQGSCNRAKQDGFCYVWIDTCCIDKSSTVELSEAINSMFRWYKHAAVCYAYLIDIHDLELRNSIWFNRGWTLQELIAPPKVEFFNSSWRQLGSKQDLQDIVSSITGIDVGLLAGKADLYDFSVAKRMSWAAYRETERVEDAAYSLLGIFGINMSMLYGEGEGAFLRLQKEIIQTSDDHSIFAWNIEDDRGHEYHGLLGPSPAAYKGCNNVVRITPRIPDNVFSMTNLGLSINLDMCSRNLDLQCAALDCAWEGNEAQSICIFLAVVKEPSQYARTCLRGENFTTLRSSDVVAPRRVNVRQKPLEAAPYLRQMVPKTRRLAFWFKRMEIFPLGFDVYPPGLWDRENNVLEFRDSFQPLHRAVFVGRHNQLPHIIKIGFDHNFNVYCQYGPQKFVDTTRTDFRSLSGWQLRQDHGDRTWHAIISGGGETTMKPHKHKIIVSKEVVDGCLMWTVDVESLQHISTEYENFICLDCGKLYRNEYRSWCFKCQASVCTLCINSVTLNGHSTAHLTDVAKTPWVDLATESKGKHYIYHEGDRNERRVRQSGTNYPGFPGDQSEEKEEKSKQATLQVIHRSWKKVLRTN